MQSVATECPSNAIGIVQMSTTELASLVQSQARIIDEQGEQIAALKHPFEWFRRQLFGQKSERFIPVSESGQLHLGEVFPVPADAAEQRQSIPAHTRRVTQTDGAGRSEELKFFDESKVPVQTIVLVHADVEGLSADQYEVIGEKVSYRLAQRPGSYQVLKYRRPVIKLKENQQILCLPAPAGILEGSRADVSFAAGLLIDKFAWHLPLYRQHQRLEAAGIHVSRPWLTQIAQRSMQLLEPIHAAQFASIRHSRVKAMDETPIKAGRSGHGKMQTGYFWPVYGELDEVCLPFHPSRSHDYVSRALGLQQAPDSVLLTDGYAAYARYAEKTGLTHAQCWAHYPESNVIRTSLVRWPPGTGVAHRPPDNAGVPLSAGFRPVRSPARRPRVSWVPRARRCGGQDRFRIDGRRSGACGALIAVSAPPRCVRAGTGPIGLLPTVTSTRWISARS